MNTLHAAKQQVPHKFDDVAGTYDLLTAMSPGYHADLRRSAERLQLGAGARILDLCCGTGASTAALRTTYPDAEIVALDASAGMLARAQARQQKLRATFVLGDATDPRAGGIEGTFDAVFMAYGIRNLPDPERGLRNLRDLVVPGGQVCFHEYSVADSWMGWAVWNVVCVGVIIPGGLVTAPRSDIYRYLRRSVNEFDGVGEFEARLLRHGFVDVHTAPMPGWQRGVLHTFLARTPAGGAGQAK